MVLVSDKPSNDIGILQTKLSDRERHETRRVGLEAMPLDRFKSPCGTMTLWNILASCVVVPDIFLRMRDQPDAVGIRTLRCPRDRIAGRRRLLSSRHRPPPC